MSVYIENLKFNRNLNDVNRVTYCLWVMDVLIVCSVLIPRHPIQTLRMMHVIIQHASGKSERDLEDQASKDLALTTVE